METPPPPPPPPPKRHSPYFTSTTSAKKVSPCSSEIESRSPFFLHSRSSVNGSIQSFGSFLQSLVGDSDVPIETAKCEFFQRSQDKLLTNGNDAIVANSQRCCCYCQGVFEPVLLHFGKCEIFRNAWYTNQKDDLVDPFVSPDQACCWQKLECKLHNCTRHLCPDHCFMKAYAPLREWHRLREGLCQHLDGPIDRILSGWRCRLQLPKANQKASIPIVEFVSPNGSYGSCTRGHLRVLRHLAKAEDDGQVYSTKRPRLTFDATAFRHCYNGLAHGEGCVESPLGLLEELFADKPWELLLTTILLNKTSRVQVDAVLYKLLKTWSNPTAIINADTKSIAAVIRPLGIYERRAVGIQRFSADYQKRISEQREVHGDQAPFHLSRNDVLSLHNCGEYSYAAYRLFVQQTTRDVHTTDHALFAFAEFQRGREANEAS